MNAMKVIKNIENAKLIKMYVVIQLYFTIQQIYIYTYINLENEKTYF